MIKKQKISWVPEVFLVVGIALVLSLPVVYVVGHHIFLTRYFLLTRLRLNTLLRLSLPLLRNFLHQFMVLVLVVLLRGLELDVLLDDAVDDSVPFGLALDQGVFEDLNLLLHHVVLLV